MAALTVYSDFGAQENKNICHEAMGPDAMIFVLCMLSFKPTFSLSSFTLMKKLFSHLHIWDCWYFSQQL